MSVEHRPHILSFLIAAQVHFDLGRGTVSLQRIQNLSRLIDMNQLFRRDKAFAHPCRGRQKRAILQFRGYVAVVGRNPSQLPHFVVYVANLLPQLHLLIVHLCSPF